MVLQEICEGLEESDQVNEHKFFVFEPESIGALYVKCVFAIFS